MYSLTVHRDFPARHRLIGGDWGAENAVHMHDYRIEVEIETEALDEHGYCVDIVAVDAALDQFLERFSGALLNEDPAFAGLNPSIEHFARIAWTILVESIPVRGGIAMTTRIWENDMARASFRRPLAPTPPDD